MLDYVEGVVSGRHEAEYRLMLQSIVAAIVLSLLAGAAYALGVGIAAPLLALVPVAALLTSFSYFHMDSYKKISCQNGMMAGMTLGMTSGFMAGALLGATNGMFVGTIIGTAAGALTGLAIGRRCGVMGALEGVMAGLMSGGMGAMASVMMLNDHLVAFIYILFGICIAISGGLSYMMHREAGPAKKEDVAGVGRYLILTVLYALFIAAVMAYGPKPTL